MKTCSDGDGQSPWSSSPPREDPPKVGIYGVEPVEMKEHGRPAGTWRHGRKRFGEEARARRAACG